MTVLLAILTFLLFATLDWLVNRRRAAAGEPGAAPALAPARVPGFAADTPPVEEPVWVAGYEMPERLHYHRGHTWARVVAPDTVVVGMDDFARRLTGRAAAVKLPAVGTWLRQGAKGIRLEADGRAAELVVPVEGEVVEVNPDLRRNPALATEDPYGRGWLLKLRSANLAANLRNLLSGNLARRWIEDAREQLELRLMALSGSVLQDGGEPAPDFAKHLKPEEWRQLAQTFFLS